MAEKFTYSIKNIYENAQHNKVQTSAMQANDKRAKFVTVQRVTEK